MRRTIVAAALLVLMPLCACGGVWRGKPPQARDNESYAFLQQALPADFAGAPVVAQWRGFTDIKDASGDGWEQCAIIVYDLQNLSINGFVDHLKRDAQLPPAEQDYALRDWLMAGDLQKAAQPNGDGHVVEDLARVAKVTYRPLDEVPDFCGMPQDQRASLADRAKAAMIRPENPLLVSDLHYGGGVAGSGDRVEREIRGVVDIEDRKLYTWLTVMPSNGY